MKHLRYLALLLFAVPAFPQSVTLTSNKVVADGELVPVLTWTSSPQGPSSCVASGGWSGIKAGAGTETLPRIVANASYSLKCDWVGTTGTATVTWVAPTTNTNGTPLTDLAGFRVFVGQSSTSFPQSHETRNAAARSLPITGLASGTWYFMVRPFNSNDKESSDSNVVQKTLTVSGQSASATVAITVRPVPSPAVVTTVVVVANTPYVPVFRLNAAGTGISSTPMGMIPTGRGCGPKVSMWRGKAIHRVVVNPAEMWACTGCSKDTTRLAAPCA